ncbi:MULTISPECIES: OmpW family protein [unclassified Duganella]|uniref:OmpW/AlkL family protein n=1 Tax=unclassified Duganella TaxID=2636909 RepID=UPI00087385B0|nr:MULTISPECIES: OmpW family outer membrane protein [unclassified Duganella]OEZ61982.1 outer membrane protein W precursor [Duganella sp. HH105]OFA02459.1 outer membrane protein W precursor [Duganella sp. HH101]
MKNTVKLLALAAALTVASAASAQQTAGTWLGTLGINKITPKVDSGDVSAPALPGTKADVGTDTKPRFAIAYMLTDNISAELDLGLPYKHDLIGAGAIQGTGKLGTSEVLPPTAFVQYRFLPANSMFRPYVGLGITYAMFQKETGSGQLTALLNTGGPGTTFKLDDKWAVSYQIGGTVKINEKWFIDATVIKTKLKTMVHFSTGQTQDVRLDPLAVSVSVGYNFKGF